MFADAAARPKRKIAQPLYLGRGEESLICAQVLKFNSLPYRLLVISVAESRLFAVYGHL